MNFCRTLVGYGLGLIVGFALAGCGTTVEESVPVEVRRAQRPVASWPLGLPAQWPVDAPMIHARSAILIDASDGRILYQKNADVPGQVASTQKLVTALVVLDAGSLEKRVVVQRSDTRVEPTKLGLRAGETYSRGALLTALIVKSGNDAAAALARDVAGSDLAFSGMMNRKARELGARNSHFLNPHGLPAPQFSTARDIARVAYAAYRQPVLRRMMAMKFYPFVFNSGRVKTLENTNDLLGVYWPVNGMKTGYTRAAGRCLVSSASLGGRDLILVQLGSRTHWIFDDAETMLRWGFTRLGSTSPQML